MPVQTRSQIKMLNESKESIVKQAQAQTQAQTQLSPNVTIRLKPRSQTAKSLRNIISAKISNRECIIDLIHTRLEMINEKRMVPIQRNTYFDILRLITETFYIINTHIETFINSNKTFIETVYRKAKELINEINNHEKTPETEEEHRIVRLTIQELYESIKTLHKHVDKSQKEPLHEINLSKMRSNLSNTHIKFIYDDEDEV